MSLSDLLQKGIVQHVSFLASSEAQTSSKCGDIEDDKLVRETDLHETGKWIRKLIPEIRWCISEWAIYDF